MRPLDPCQVHRPPSGPRSTIDILSFSAILLGGLPISTNRCGYTTNLYQFDDHTKRTKCWQCDRPSKPYQSLPHRRWPPISFLTVTKHYQALPSQMWARRYGILFQMFDCLNHSHGGQWPYIKKRSNYFQNKILNTGCIAKMLHPF